eukprot:NODE_1066_length_1253_cov_1.241235.p1 GENE.NODE_1066_length_1253_cov_1.241235~~NODE_1066_length_1253_cov_1.241235.p1  ORF type:complete len:244 (-),score=25.36 NODE_1066_length_1253_cov_1.241235:255-986(-)
MAGGVYDHFDQRFKPAFEQWLNERCIEDRLWFVETVEDRTGKLSAGSAGSKGFEHKYEYIRPLTPPLPACADIEQRWEPAYHGTLWYGLWNILSSGLLLESCSEEKGHDFTVAGVYSTPLLEKACYYALPQVLFNDNVYHQLVLELKVFVEERRMETPREAVGARHGRRGVAGDKGEGELTAGSGNVEALVVVSRARGKTQRGNSSAGKAGSKGLRRAPTKGNMLVPWGLPLKCPWKCVWVCL